MRDVGNQRRVGDPGGSLILGQKVVRHVQDRRHAFVYLPCYIMAFLALLKVHATVQTRKLILVEPKSPQAPWTTSIFYSFHT